MEKIEIPVKEWMSAQLRTVDSTTPVGDAYNIMMKHGIRRLPVVDKGKLVGIVTLGDLREARPSPAGRPAPSAVTDPASRYSTSVV